MCKVCLPNGDNGAMPSSLESLPEPSIIHAQIIDTEQLNYGFNLCLLVLIPAEGM